jgi:hypothetical protein
VRQGDERCAAQRTALLRASPSANRPERWLASEAERSGAISATWSADDARRAAGGSGPLIHRAPTCTAANRTAGEERPAPLSRCRRVLPLHEILTGLDVV